MSELQQIYNEMSLLLRSYNFLFLTRYFGDTHCLIYKKLIDLICLYIFCQLSVFPNTFVRIFPIQLKIDFFITRSILFETLFFICICCGAFKNKNVLYLGKLVTIFSFSVVLCLTQKKTPEFYLMVIF